VNWYPFIEAENAGNHNVTRACELLKVSRSAYYADRANPGSCHPRRDAELTGKIIEIHDESEQTYGSRRAARPGAAVRRRSREMGNGARPTRRAISLSPAPRACSTAISSRSSNDR
jgi:hypothetical protein